MSDHDKQWHASFKPRFTQTGGLVYKSNGTDKRGDSAEGWGEDVLVEGHRDVLVTSMKAKENVCLHVLCDSKSQYH